LIYQKFKNNHKEVNMSYSFKIINDVLFFIEQSSKEQFQVKEFNKEGMTLYQVEIPFLNIIPFEAKDAKALFNEVVESDRLKRSFKRQTSEEFVSRFKKMKSKLVQS